MQEHECLIDFIAVSPDARGKGVGAKLMRWAEQAGSDILAETETAAMVEHGVEMTLWVAADNTAALRLYERSGFVQVKRTDTGACRCMASAVLEWFLGHPVWVKMHKVLPVPPQLAAVQPPQQSMAVPAGGCTAPAAAAAAAGLREASFVTVPLDGHDSTQRQPLSAVPSSPGSSLLSKLGLGYFSSTAAASAGSTPRGGASSAAAPSLRGLATCEADSQGVTPRIAAVGSGLPAAGQPAGHSTAGGLNNKDDCPGEQPMQCISLHASAQSSYQHQQQPQQPQQHLRQHKLPLLAAAPASSAASASIASMPLADSDMDSGGEDHAGAPASASSNSIATRASQVEAFELVELSTTSVTAAVARA